MSDPEIAALSSARDGEHGLHCTIYRDGAPSAGPERLHDISEVLREEGSLVWFDAVDPGPEDLALVEEEFGLHPLAIEDAVQAHQRPKVESYGTYWFLVVQGATLSPDGNVVLHEIAIFAGKNFLVTVRHDPPYPLAEIEARWQAHPERLRRGAGFLLYTILDTIVDGYFPIVDAFQDRVDNLDQALFENRPLMGDVLREIFALKQQGSTFRRAAAPVREMLNPIIRGDLPLYPEEELLYFRDVYDHSVRVTDSLDTLRDLVSSALDIHLSVVANRQNEVAKQLTTIATIFLPLSFLVGFFGQNFAFLVAHIQSTGSFWLLGIGSEIVAIGIMLVYFRRRRWL